MGASNLLLAPGAIQPCYAYGKDVNFSVSTSSYHCFTYSMLGLCIFQITTVGSASSVNRVEQSCFKPIMKILSPELLYKSSQKVTSVGSYREVNFGNRLTCGQRLQKLFVAGLVCYRAATQCVCTETSHMFALPTHDVTILPWTQEAENACSTLHFTAFLQANVLNAA